jgi:hypothetical protein
MLTASFAGEGDASVRQAAQPGGVHPYLIGEGEVRTALDSVRAARQMVELTLDMRTVVWGHSQGGHAGLWAGYCWTTLRARR